MNKVAIVVQRCHETIVGGSESLAWQYATLLGDSYEVDVLTTAALDTSDWANALPEGAAKKDNVNVLRFRVTSGRSAYWGQLHQRLISGCSPFSPGRRRGSEYPPQLQWTLPLQEEFILKQGPHSEGLMQFIRQRWKDYRVMIFVTYLYPTTYFGLQQVPPGRALFAPTLHDERTAYLPAFKQSAERARELIWLTEAEQRVGRRLWGQLPGRVVSMAIDTKRREPPTPSFPYLLYCGRVDPNKGCAQMFEYFIRFQRTFPTRLRLIITGKEDIRVPDHPDIEFRGFVSNEEKLSLMSGATVYLMPSPNESFSIVTLEAMAQGTAILANGNSPVLTDHIKRSGAGRVYDNYNSFAAALTEMLSERCDLAGMGTYGRDYVVSQYHTERIRAALIEAVESCGRPSQHRNSGLAC